MNLKFGYGLLIVVLLFALPLFTHLDQMPLQAWDESRLANNALEMMQNHNPVVTFYNGSPDLWNTKPPLMIWMQAVSMKIFGVSVLSVRLPAALAAAFTCILVFWFMARKLRLPWLGVFSVLVLVTLPGYVVSHGTRTGDYDSLLVLFTTAYTLFFFWHLETGERKWLAFFFTALTAAVLTKGIAGLFLASPLLLYAFTQKQALQTLKMPWLYIGIALFLLLGPGYYLLREHYNPGYIAAVNANELGGRYLTVLENHKEDNWYYWNSLIDHQLNYWYLLVPGGIAFGLAAKDKRLRRFTLLLLLAVACFLLIISTAGTKLRWYNLPALPFIAMLCGMALWYVLNLVNSFQNRNNFRWLYLLLLLLILTIGFFPYRRILENGTDAKPDPWLQESENIGYFLQENLKGARCDTALHVFQDKDEQHIVWYRKAIRIKGREVPFTGLSRIVPGQKIAVYTHRTQDILNSAFYTHIIEQVNGVNIYSVDSIRNKE